MTSLDNVCPDAQYEHEVVEDNMEDIKKNLLSELTDNSPVKASIDGGMPPPPPPSVEEESETMRVFLRVRPLKEEEKLASEDQGCVVVNGSAVHLSAPKTSKAYSHCGGKLLQMFTFHQVYDEYTSQKIMFEDTMLGTVKDFVDGQNCLVFAYGVTNSGKTYTMLGTPGEQGIIPRSLEVIFNSVGGKQSEHSALRPQLYSQVKELSTSDMTAADKFKAMVLTSASKAISDTSDLYSSCDSLASQSSIGESLIDGMDGDRISICTEGQGDIKFSVWVSFAEIYNEQIYDLLEPPTKNKRKTLTLREDRNGNPYIKDLRHIQVCSADEAVKVMAFGQRNLQYACTKLNESSSRSHCIYNVKIVRVADVLHPTKAQMSQLSFCDLAGSERYTRTGNVGERLKEAANINTSLLTLGRCIKILRENQLSRVSKVVPFRESKLTRLFQAYFCRKGRASMIVNLSPAASSFDENLNVLKFSAAAKQVQIIPDKLSNPKTSRTEVSLALEQEMEGRQTIQWGSTEELEEVAEEEEVVNGTAEWYQQAIEKLKRALIDVNELLKQERKSKKKLETKLRAEICQEMIHQVTEIESNYQQQLESQRQRCEDAADEKVKYIASAVRKSVRRKQEESEEEMNDIIKALHVKLDRKEFELEEVREELKETKETLMEKEVTQKVETVKEVTEKVELEKEESSEREMDITGNEIFIAINRQLEEARSLVVEKEALISNLELTLEEATETFQEKEDRIAKLTSTNATLQLETETLAKRISELEHEGKKRAADVHSEHMEEREKRRKEHSTVLEESQSTISELTAKLQESSAAHSNIMNEIRKQYEAKVKELEMEVVAVSRGLQASDRLKEEAEKELAGAKNKLEQLEFDFDEKVLLLEGSQSEVEQMKAEIAKRTKEYDGLVEEMRQLKSTLDTLSDSQQSSKEMQDKCSLLTTNMKKLQDQLRRRSVELQGDIGSVQTQLLAARKELSRMKQDKEKLTVECTDYQCKLQQLRRENSTHSDELERNAEQLTESQSTVSDLSSKLSVVEVELSDALSSKYTAEEEVASLRELLQKSECQSSTLESTVYKLRKEIAAVGKEQADKLDTAAKDNRVLNETIVNLEDKQDEEILVSAFLESQIEEYKKKLTEQTSLLECANNKMAELTTDNVKLEEKLSNTTFESQSTSKDLLAKLSSLNTELLDTKNDKAATNVELQDIREQLKDSEATVCRLREAIDEQTEENALLKESTDVYSSKLPEIEELKSELEVSSREKQELKDEVDSLQTSLTESNARCDKFAALAMRVKDMDNKLDEHKLLYERATAKISELTAENSKLKEELHTNNEQSATVTRLEQQVETLTEDVRTKEKKCASLQVILDARQCEWESKDSSHESVKQQAEKTEKALNEANAELRSELAALGSQLSELKDKLRSQTTSALFVEKGLHSKVADLEAQLTSLTEELKVAKSRVVPPVKPEGQDNLIEQLKSAISEQEKTMKVQDEVVESKEEQIHQLTTEICDWRLKCQELSDAELERTAISSRLTTVTNEKSLLQENHTETVKRMKVEIDRLASEKSELQTQIEEAKEKSLVAEKDKEITELKAMMAQWQEEKQTLVGELEKVLKKKDETIEQLQSNTDEDISKKMEKMEEKVVRKDKIILQLEQKIRHQESTIQDMVVGSGRTTRTRSNTTTSSQVVTEEMEKIQNLEAELKHEQSLHSETQKVLDRFLVAQDEKGADLKLANIKLQKEIQRLNSLLKCTPARRSDRFKEPCFTNDNELCASTLELDVTPMSSSKKETKSTTKNLRRSTRKSSSALKENIPSTSKTSTLKKRLQDIVEKSTSPLASPAKKLLQVRVAPLNGTPSDEQQSTSGRPTRRRRKLYNTEQSMLNSTPEEESSSAKRARETRSSSNFHSNVLRNLRSSQLK